MPILKRTSTIGYQKTIVRSRMERSADSKPHRGKSKRVYKWVSRTTPKGEVRDRTRIFAATERRAEDALRRSRTKFGYGTRTRAVASKGYVPKPISGYRPKPLKPYAPVSLKPYTPVPLKPYTPLPVRDYTPVPLKPYTPLPVRDYTPVPLKPYKPVPLKPYAPVSLKPYAPVPLKDYTPVSLKPYSPVPLKPYKPVPSKAYAPVPLKPYTPVLIKPYTPVPPKKYATLGETRKGPKGELIKGGTVSRESCPYCEETIELTTSGVTMICHNCKNKVRYVPNG